MAKNTNETVNEAKNTISYANDVVSTIAGIAASEVEGIASMCSVNGGILNKKKDVTKGVKVEVGTEEVSVDLYIIVEYGKPIQKAAQDAQESVRKAIESMTGLHVVRVDVHVQGVNFEKENNTLPAGDSAAALYEGKKEEKPAAKPAEDDRGAFEVEAAPAAPAEEVVDAAADFVEEKVEEAAEAAAEPAAAETEQE